MFEANGYLKEKANFICSLESHEQTVKEVTKNEIENWNRLWKYQHLEFEKKIKDIEWEFLNNRYLYTWDGNHRLAAWTRVIKEG